MTLLSAQEVTKAEGEEREAILSVAAEDLDDRELRRAAQEQLAFLVHPRVCVRICEWLSVCARIIRK